MPALIKGVKPEHNVYTYKRNTPTGRCFRQKPTQAHRNPVTVTVDAEGVKTRTSVVKLRAPRDPSKPLSDRQILAMLARTILSPATVPTRRRGRSVGGSGPTLSIRG